MASPDSHDASRLANGTQTPTAKGRASVVSTAGAAVLPNRNVTSSTFEDAYVSFIFYCNPALPPAPDTEALREAFRNPPKSAGKSFDTFDIYELVKKFYGKEIKTWTELTIKLGVEPPDPSKDESSQKVTQYGVRLKKWMNSLHVKSFFEYLMNIPNDYWTKIPDDPDPTSQPIRDGVALEDDMALRALIPHIRPKRGRKRPDDGETTPAAQRLRLSPFSTTDAVAGQGGVVPWPRPADGLVSAHLGFAKSAHPGSGPNDGSEAPFSQWPNSAITPTMRGSFWDDALEPQSAITPTGSKLGRQRRGAKNVSSAWKLGGLESGGKTRGRPPMNRTPVDGPNMSFHPWAHPQSATRPAANTSLPGNQTAKPPPTPTSNSKTSHGFSTGSIPPPPVRTNTSAPAAPAARLGHQGPLNNPRPARPSISLQVPERAGGPVRLATPPPLVMVNGQENPEEGANNGAGTTSSDRWNDFAKEATDKYEFAANLSTGRPMEANNATRYYFEKIDDRTNVDSLLSYFVQTAHESQWFDEHGNPAEPASMNEAVALVNATLENMLKTSTSPQAFLINLAALAGARTLLATTPKCFRLGDDDDFYNYRFEWEYRFGHFSGQFNMAQSVPRSMWEKPKKDGTGEGTGDEEGGSSLSAEDWRRKYKMLLGEMKKRDQELAELRAKVMMSVQRDRP